VQRNTPGNGGDIDDRALVLQLDHLRRHFASAEEHAGQVDIDHRLPLRQTHLGHLTIFHADGQAITQDAGIVDQPVDGTEVVGHLGDHMSHLLFIGDVTQVGTSVTTGSLASGHGFIEFFLVQIDQRQLGALGRQVLTHGTAQPLATASDDDDFVFQLHRFIPSRCSIYRPR